VLANKRLGFVGYVSFVGWVRFLNRLTDLSVITGLTMLLAVCSHAALWSGIIDPNRATDWTSAGVVGGIPSASWANCATPACSTLLGGNVTAATIEAALQSAPANTVVRIPAGTFTLSTGFNHSYSNIVLRGAGASATKLIITNTIPNSVGGMGLPRVVNLMSGATGGGRGGATTANWTAGYAKDATVITLSNTSGLTAGPVGTGSLIVLDQLNDAADGYPAAGDLYVCENGTPCSNQGGNNYARPGRAQVQVVTVTGISGNQVTISPGLALPNWRASQSPGAYWNPGSPLHNAGIEDLTVDFSAAGGSGIFIKDAANVWVTGTRWIKTDAGTSECYHMALTMAAHLTIRSNYFSARPFSGGSFPLANYTVTDQEVSDIVFENNILHGNMAALVPNDPMSRNVYAYNVFEGGNLGVAGIQLHSGAVMMELYEGNNLQSFMGDIIHGPHYLGTVFRNHFDGEARNHSQTTGYAVGLNTHNRFFNVIGNVMGDASYTGYEQINDLSSPWNPIYSLGWAGNASGGTVNPDPDVPRTTMRWGNWDSETSSTRFLASEVPSGIAHYPNPVPASQSLPPSFYMASQPAWWTTPWGTPKWPAVGPEVTGGNATLSPTGGHADKIPSRLCLENTAVDPAYPNSSPRIKLFNAAACYGTTPAPTNACDLNTDNATNVSDVQLCVNQAIGSAACTRGDINQDSSCNVVDVQRTVNAALGGQCVTQ
jgi:hypothetical protein